MSIPRPTDLRCEYLRNPLGVDATAPRFSWKLQHQERGQTQGAYQVLVSSEAETTRGQLGDLWDSGKVVSSRAVNIPYGGKPLVSGRRYYWRVRWWDKDGIVSEYSDPAFFEMGLLNGSDWKAKWIGKKMVKEFTSRGSTVLGQPLGEYIQAFGVYLRKEFSVKKRVQTARAYVSGLGWYELYINGEKIGDHVLDPAQTDYRKLALYSTFDVTEVLRASESSSAGRSAIGVLLGNGRHIKNYGYGTPRLLLEVAVEYEGGEKELVCSDTSWKACHGPLQENGMYFGERYDARLEMPGWDRPGFDDSHWEQAVEVEGTNVVSQMMPPIRLMQRLKPKTMHSPASGIYVYDFGQNFTGWAKLTVQGSRGSEVKLRHAELVHDDGTLNTSPNQNAEATDVYILKGEGIETHEPRFTYHGFRYVEVTGFPGVPTLDSIMGCFVHTDVERTGTFTSSHSLINRIHGNILWGQLSNLMSIPTDCTQRDERHGWLGDAHLAAEAAIFNFDMAAFYTKFLRDIQLAQRNDGSLPDTVPPYLGGLYPADPAWSSAYITLAWYLFTYCEDERVLHEHYDSMRRYIDFLRNNTERHIIRTLGKYGDWCPPGSIAPKRTPVELTSTWYYYHDTLLLSRIAAVLARKEDVAFYAQLANDIEEAFNREFLRGDEYAVNRFAPVDQSPGQTSNVLPLYLEMVPDEKKTEVLHRLLDSVANEQGYHLDTGIIGSRYLLDVLTNHGHGEAAFKVAAQRSYPGWGYMVQEGATTLWERWEKIEGGGMNSHNHIMLGSVDAWFYKYIAGIICLSPGWKEILFKPPLFGDLQSASAVLRTIRGDAAISWERRPERFDLKVTVPVTSSAEVCVPLVYEECVIREGKTVLWDRSEAKEPRVREISRGVRKGAYVHFALGSGAYEFVVLRHR
ncbi:MAG: alpha-L-rhamnosidase [Ignavibacteria bacterium]|nr:alpha-L-rhamnosidase [Ignavibacteria bacterium]